MDCDFAAGSGKWVVLMKGARKEVRNCGGKISRQLLLLLFMSFTLIPEFLLPNLIVFPLTDAWLVMSVLKGCKATLAENDFHNTNFILFFFFFGDVKSIMNIIFRLPSFSQNVFREQIGGEICIQPAEWWDNTMAFFCEKSNLNSLVNHPKKNHLLIHFLFCLFIAGCRGAGANPSWHRMKGGAHPGQFASLPQS